MAIGDLLFFTQPFFDALRGFPLWYIGSFKVTIPLLWGAVIMSIVFIRLAVKKSSRISPDAAIIGGILIFTTALSALVSSLKGDIDSTEFNKSFIHLLFWVSFFIAATTYSISKRDIVLVGKIKLFVGCLVALYGIYQYFASRYGWPYDHLEINSSAVIGEYNRICSVYTEPIYLSMEMVFLLTIVSTGYFFKFINKKIAVPLVIIYGYTLFLSSSLSAILVLFAITAFTSMKLFGNRRHRRILLRSIFIGTIVVLVIMNITPDVVKESLGRRTKGIIAGDFVPGESYSTRKAQIVESMEHFVKNPLFGIGWGQGKVVMKGERISPLYLTLLMEIGILAVVFIFISYVRIRKYLIWHLGANMEAKIKFTLTVLLLTYAIGFIGYGYLMDSAIWYLLAMIIGFHPKMSTVNKK